MDNPDDLLSILEKLVAESPAGRTGLAAALGVSEATVSRWLFGKGRPQPQIEGKLRDLYRSFLTEAVAEPALSLFDWDHGLRDQDLRTVLGRTLRDLRECLHRSGRLSSRHEALDELAKLTFAHVLSIDSGGPGISPHLEEERRPADALRSFVATIYNKHLPKSLALELKPADFALRLKDSENPLASQIISCFKPLADPAIASQMAGVASVDVLNEVFGQFLADSFMDEKELGQYLTPSEVVRFMTRLGLNSLSEEDRVRLADPRYCSRVGLIVDPSCGVSSFLCEVLRVLHPEVRKLSTARSEADWFAAMMNSVLVGIDKSERMIRLALTNLALFGAPAAQLHLANAITRTGRDALVTKGLEGKARLILTNPPFGAQFDPSEVSEYQIANAWASRSPTSVDSELLLLERYFDWLAPGGVLVAVVPDSVLTNRGIYKDLRRALSHSAEIHSVISLPQEAFVAAGTSTKTSILHAVKRRRKASASTVYFAICRNLGFEVTTRGSQRTKVATGNNELLQILPEVCGEAPAKIGRYVTLDLERDRWDAGFNASLPTLVARRMEAEAHAGTRVLEVASLSDERVDPRRRGEKESFQYIEISDIGPDTHTVQSKPVTCAQAPTRARKPVRAGDVLVSTVRPDRKAIAVVPEVLDGAVCSTGFAVLRPFAIDPTLLATLLRTEFATVQILRHNIGIAYPAVEESCLLNVVLPLAPSELQELGAIGKELREQVARVNAKHLLFSESVRDLVGRWSEEPLPRGDSKHHQSRETTSHPLFHREGSG